MDGQQFLQDFMREIQGFEDFSEIGDNLSEKQQRSSLRIINEDFLNDIANELDELDEFIDVNTMVKEDKGKNSDKEVCDYNFNDKQVLSNLILLNQSKAYQKLNDGPGFNVNKVFAGRRNKMKKPRSISSACA